jgi:multidrug efflux pump subunit AcrA (membrane-fusion protein)
MAFFERTREAAAEDLQDQIAALSHQISALQKAMRKRGYAAFEDGKESAGDLYGEAWDRFHDALPVIRKRAYQAERAARDNPAVTAAVVGVVLAGLAVAFLSRK